MATTTETIRDQPYEGNVYQLTLTLPNIKRPATPLPMFTGVLYTQNVAIKWEIHDTIRITRNYALEDLLYDRMCNLFWRLEASAYNREKSLYAFKFNVKVVDDHASYITSSQLAMTNFHRGNFTALQNYYLTQVYPVLIAGISGDKFMEIMREIHPGDERGSDTGSMPGYSIDAEEGYLLLYCCYRDGRTARQLEEQVIFPTRYRRMRLHHLQDVPFTTPLNQVVALLREEFPHVSPRWFDTVIRLPLEDAYHSRDRFAFRNLLESLEDYN